MRCKILSWYPIYLKWRTIKAEANHPEINCVHERQQSILLLRCGGDNYN
ncbi:MAG: hypothetical protein LBF56_00045 [Holosporales bacterium]|nr:hypothetical protein [Holosporales bacterium]